MQKTKTWLLSFDYNYSPISFMSIAKADPSLLISTCKDERHKKRICKRINVLSE